MKLPFFGQFFYLKSEMNRAPDLKCQKNCTKDTFLKYVTFFKYMHMVSTYQYKLQLFRLVLEMPLETF